MSEQDVNVGINARSNIPTVVQKVIRSIISLENNLGDLKDVLQDLAKFSAQASGSIDDIGKSTKNVSKGTKDAAESVGTLRDALQKTGKEASEALNKIDFHTVKDQIIDTSTQFANLTTGEITQLSEKLTEAGSSLGAFLSNEKIDLNLAPAVEELNKLQELMGQPLSLAADFSSADEALVATRALNDELRNGINETVENLERLARTTKDSAPSEQLAKQLEPLEQLRSTIQDIQGGASGSAFKDLFNFEEVRNGAQTLVISIESIQEKMRDVGPAAQAGSEQAIKDFLELEQQLKSAGESALKLQTQLREAQSQFADATAGQNQSLGAMGFREVKLDDIFPTAEQQKIVQIQSKIDAAVRTSVQEGAVKETLNFFLAQDRQIESVDRNVVSLTSHLPRLRYALYDVANTATIFGTVIVGAITATVKFAADYERAFADVIRTNELSVDSAKELRREMIQLSKDIPVAFADLAEIATLAGQLNISKNAVAEFTETVAQFSATTDVTIDGAATAFGRLDQLVDGVNGQFEKLGSSILKVGINAVATESDIVAISTQIASVANIAGFSASELIGFSSALASVGTRPELARGTFTRLFTEIQQAVAESGEQLDLFAKTAGQSSEQFSSAWGAGAGADQVVAVLRGLEAAGNDADGVLRELGITSVRDVPTLLKLAQSVEEVEKQIAIATLGFDEGTELQEQYGIITGTLSEKLEILKNNFAALTASFGTLAGPVAIAVDILSKFLGVLESIASTKVGGAVVGTVAFVGALVGVAALGVGVLARFGASTAGLATAMIELRETIAFTKIQVDALGASTESATVKKLREIAVTRQKVAQQAKDAVSIARNTVATNASTISSGKKTVSLTVLQARLASTGAGLLAYTARVRLAGAAAIDAARQTKLYAASIGLLKGAAGLGALVALGAAVEFVTKKMQELNGETETAEERFEDWGTILEAVKSDSRDFANATEENIDEFTVLGESVKKTGEEVGNYSRIVAVAGGNEDKLATLLGNSTDAFNAQTIAIGKNTRAILAQKLAKELAAAADSDFELALENIGIDISDIDYNTAEPAIKIELQARSLDALISTLGTDLSDALTESGFDFAEWSDAVISGNVELAAQIAGDLEPAVQKLLEQLRSEDPRKFAEEIETLSTISKGGGEALVRFVESGSEVQLMLREAQIALAITGGVFQDFEDGVDGAEVATDSFKNALNEIVDSYFGPINAQRQMEESIISLGEVFFNEGAEIAATSQEMEKAIKDVIATASSPEEAVDALGGFFGAIVDGGYASEEQLGILQGVIIDTYRTATAAQLESLQQAREALVLTRQMTLMSAMGSDRAGIIAAQRLDRAKLDTYDRQIKALEKSREAIGNIAFGTANSAESAALLARGYTQAERATRKTGKATKDVAENTKEAAEEVRTLLDFASDLQKVYSRAFDIRFGASQAVDTLAESWEKFGETVEDARAQVEELQAAQQDLGADRAIKQYFLSVAEAYDDQLRAAKLREELSQLDKDQAENARELLAAEQIAGGDLTSQGPGSRQNRQALLGLVGNYQSYITVLAESGASQSELRQETERARREFTQQARELGFQEKDIQTYAAAFDDVQTAIANVERNITVEANVNPALQALNELNASLNKQIDTANDLSRALNQPVATRTPTTTSDTTTGPTPEQEKAIRKAQLQSQISALQRRLPSAASGARNPALNRQIAQLLSKLRSGNYAQGGYTGSGGKMEPAGIVHRGEYVIPKQFVNQSSGMPDPSFLAQMQSGMRNYFVGGFVGGGSAGNDGTMMVELSPFDRKLLADAGNVQLRLNGRVVAEATNQNNFNQARKGSD